MASWEVTLCFRCLWSQFQRSSWKEPVVWPLGFSPSTQLLQHNQHEICLRGHRKNHTLQTLKPEDGLSQSLQARCLWVHMRETRGSTPKSAHAAKTRPYIMFCWKFVHPLCASRRIACPPLQSEWFPSLCGAYSKHIIHSSGSMGIRRPCFWASKFAFGGGC